MANQLTPDLTNTWNDPSDTNNEPTFTKSQYYDLAEFCNVFSEQSPGNFLKVFNTNSRSLPLHMKDYKLLFESIYQTTKLDFDIISFSETWLNSDLEQLTFMNGYSALYKHKVHKKEGGGLAIFVKDGLSFKNRPDLAFPCEFHDKFDALFVELELGSRSDNVILGVMYRSPSNRSQKDFIQCANVLVEKIEKEHKNVIILGDNNVDLLKTDIHKESNKFLSLFISRGFIPAITLPTRVTHRSASLIDHIFVKSKIPNHLAGTLTLDITDHYANFICLPKTSKQSNSKYVSYRNFSDSNVNKLKDALINQDWTAVVQCDDTNAAYNDFMEVFSNKFELCLPKVTRTFHKYRHKKEPWITLGLLTSMRKRDKLFARIASSPGPIAKAQAKAQYNSYRNCLNRFTKMQKKKLLVFCL